MEDAKENMGLKRLGGILLKLYWTIGAIAVGILAVLVIFTVVMRYCFSLNWKQLAEFNVTLFAFTTFWGLGFCVLKNEHVMIDVLYDGLPIKVKRMVGIVNYLISIGVMAVFVKYGIDYVKLAGVQLSLGMEIPMIYMYGIMPVTGVLCIICLIIKIIETVNLPDDAFLPHNAKLREGRK